MSFLYPYVFIFSLLVFFFLRYVSHILPSSIPLSTAMRKVLFRSGNGLSIRVRNILWLMGALCFLIALARPVLPPEKSVTEGLTTDIFIALDVSRSMNATDIAPTRLLAARENIASLFERIRNERVSLLGFSKNTLVIAPPSRDPQLLAYLFRSFDTSLVTAKSTEIMPLLRIVAKASKSPSKHLIIVSDGGDNDNFTEEISFARQEGIHISVLGMATEKGEQLFDDNNKTLKTNEGFMVISALNRSIEMLCRETGGEFIRFNESHHDIRRIWDGVVKNAQYENNKLESYGYRELFMYPLLLGLFLILWADSRKITFMFFLCILLPTPHYAALLDGYYALKGEKCYTKGDYDCAIDAWFLHSLTQEQTINLGSAYYKKGVYQKALDNWGKITKQSPELQAKVWYNIANTYVKLEDYDKAKEYYKRVLSLTNDPQAKANLALIAGLKTQKMVDARRNDPKAREGKEKGEGEKKEGANVQSSSQNGKEENPSRGKTGRSGMGEGNGNGGKGNKQHAGGSEENTKPMSAKQLQILNQGGANEKHPW